MHFLHIPLAEQFKQTLLPQNLQFWPEILFLQTEQTLNLSIIIRVDINL